MRGAIPGKKCSIFNVWRNQILQNIGLFIVTVISYRNISYTRL